MPYFGEVREFATGMIVVSISNPLQLEKRIWTGIEWAAYGTDACTKTLQAITDEKAAEVVFDPEAP